MDIHGFPRTEEHVFKMIKPPARRIYLRLTDPLVRSRESVAAVGVEEGSKVMIDR